MGDFRSQPSQEPVRRCKHDVSEDCPACAEETIAGLKARNDALHENNVLALRQIEELAAALRQARAFINPDADPPRISNRAMVRIIDAALQPSTPAVSR